MKKHETMKTVLYIAPVDWRWIKQRPQFLAEELSAYGHIHVLYPYANNRKGLQKKAETRVALTPYFSLPSLHGRLPVAAFNTAWVTAKVWRLIKKLKPAIIWLTLPQQIAWIPEDYAGQIVYDCMDDYLAIHMDQSKRHEMAKMECETVRRADTVFVSSENLKSLLKERYDVENAVLLRNGYNANWKKTETSVEKKWEGGSKLLRIGYFGTIGRWFDFEMLKSGLAAQPNVEYHFYGPIEKGVQIPKMERTIYHGVVEHDEIMRVAQNLDALMMPFVLNDIVRSVDPVKLYEYIYLNKNILCVRYAEIERFAPFVRFYDDQESFAQQLHWLDANRETAYSAEQAENFLVQNSWRERARKISEILEL